MKIDVKWAEFLGGDVAANLQVVGILDAVITKNTVFMPNIASKDFNLFMMTRGYPAKVEFAVPAYVVPPGNEPKVMIGGFGPKLTAKLGECYRMIERYGLPSSKDDNGAVAAFR